MGKEIFKKGDRVICVGGPLPNRGPGTIYATGHGGYHVKWDNGNTFHCFPDHLRLVEEPLTITRQAVLDAVNQEQRSFKIGDMVISKATGGLLGSIVSLGPEICVTQEADDSALSLVSTVNLVHAYENEREPFDFRDGMDLHTCSFPIYIGHSNAPDSLRGKCIVVESHYRVEVTEHKGRAIIALYEK